MEGETTFVGDRRVAHGGLDVFVIEKFLDGAEIVLGFQKLGMTISSNIVTRSMTPLPSRTAISHSLKSALFTRSGIMYLIMFDFL